MKMCSAYLEGSGFILKYIHTLWRQTWQWLIGEVQMFFTPSSGDSLKLAILLPLLESF